MRTYSCFNSNDWCGMAATPSSWFSATNSYYYLSSPNIPNLKIFLFSPRQIFSTLLSFHSIQFPQNSPIFEFPIPIFASRFHCFSSHPDRFQLDFNYSIILGLNDSISAFLIGIVSARVSNFWIELWGKWKRVEERWNRTGGRGWLIQLRRMKIKLRRFTNWKKFASFCGLRMLVLSRSFRILFWNDWNTRVPL